MEIPEELHIDDSEAEAYTKRIGRIAEKLISENNVPITIPQKMESDNETCFSSNNKTKINRNYYLLFIKPEIRVRRIASLTDKMRIQFRYKQKISAIATLLRLKFIEKVKLSRLLTETEMYFSIGRLTSNISKEKHNYILNNLLRFKLVDDIQENNGVISFKTIPYGEIRFSTIKNFFPDLEEDLRLNSFKRRSRNCHEDSCIYAKKLKQIGIENDVVTANRLIFTDVGRSLHSWNEFSINGKDHVLDFTQNFVMNKEGYYAFNRIDEILGRVSCNDIDRDLKILTNISDSDIDYKTYLTSRDEIMKDLERNLKFFDNQGR